MSEIKIPPHAYAKFFNPCRVLCSPYQWGLSLAGIIPNQQCIANHMDIQLHSGGRIKGQFMMVIATTLDKLLLNSKPFGTHGEGKIGFSCVEHRPWAVFRALTSLITGNFSKKSINGIHTRRGDDIIITGSDPVTLDGEIYEIPENSAVHLFTGKELHFLSLN